MKPPNDELRATVFDAAQRSRPLTDRAADGELAGLIGLIINELEREISEHPAEEDDPEELAATCHAWTSLVSHALELVYAPMSPFPRNVAGWGQSAIHQVQKFARALQTPLSAAQAGLGASSYSITVGFPWGVSIGFTWP